MFKNPRSFKLVQITIFVAYFIFTFFSRFLYLASLKTYSHLYPLPQLIQEIWLSIITHSVLFLVLATLGLSLILFGFVRYLLQAHWRTNLVATLRIASLSYVISATMVALFALINFGLLIDGLWYYNHIFPITVLLLLLALILLVRVVIFSMSSSVQILQSYQASLETKRIKKILMIPQIISIAIGVVLGVFLIVNIF